MWKMDIYNANYDAIYNNYNANQCQNERKSVQDSRVVSIAIWNRNKSIEKVQYKKLDVTERRMLIGMCEVTSAVRIRNSQFKGTVKVVEASVKAQERKLQWFGHVKKRGMTAMEMDVQGRHRSERPQLQWKDRLKEDLREGHLGEEQVMDK